MILLLTQSVENTKTEMKQASKEASETHRNLERSYKKVGVTPSHVRSKLDELALKMEMYSVSKVLPVRIEGVVINYKIYSALLKKLKGFEIDTSVNPDGITLHYCKREFKQYGKGTLTLHDLSKYFTGFNHIPEARLVDPYGQET